MWDKLKELHIVNVIAAIIAITCFIVVLGLNLKVMFAQQSLSIEMLQYISRLTDKFFDTGMVAVMGWAFTSNKKPPSPTIDNSQTTINN
jgi:hypothetical protein